MSWCTGLAQAGTRLPPDARPAPQHPGEASAHLELKDVRLEPGVFRHGLEKGCVLARFPQQCRRWMDR